MYLDPPFSLRLPPGFASVIIVSGLFALRQLLVL